METTNKDEQEQGIEIPLENLVEHCLGTFESALRRVFRDRREFFVHEIAEYLQQTGLNPGGAAPPGEQWLQVESLSRLRSVVGGRFQNLRERWVAAGLPLREHRGDKSTGYTIDEKGWIELTNWILKQGYEARLAAADSDYLFELRALRR